MHLATISTPAGPTVIAKRSDGRFVPLPTGQDSIPATLQAILETWDTCRQAIETVVETAQPLDEPPQQWCPPIPTPEKILCIGLNYADHARETGAALPTEPVVFSKLAPALTGHEQPIELPEVSDQVDYEAELVVVIGRGGRHIPPDQAWEHVGGLTCGHDVSARDWQKLKSGGQWLLGKSFDTFAPVGPFVVTADECCPPLELDIALRLNGQVMQQSNTRNLIFSVADLIAHISQVTTLRSGDLIFTGTPPGVGCARVPPRFLQPGDVAEVEIEGIGVLRNPVVQGTRRGVG